MSGFVNLSDFSRVTLVPLRFRLSACTRIPEPSQVSSDSISEYSGFWWFVDSRDSLSSNLVLLSRSGLA